ncbi:MAG: hypothetical protein ACI865_000676 [Flavobacteriaceae bacterium]|jgi:hypothetical protein
MRPLKVLLLLFVFLSASYNAHACSMYKITVGDKTMVGTNEDAWRTESQIWFETGSEGEYGACYTGSRKVGHDSYAAQSGMNEHGLVYSRLESYHPLRINSKGKDRKKIDRPDDFLKQILHLCKDVNEVDAYLKQYDHSIFIDDVFIFIDPTGYYLVVEPYSMQIGREANYVLSNFCPSITTEDQRRNLGRYRSGVDYLVAGADTSHQFCTSLSDTMHVCRDKLGDGTLLTGIWDTKNKVVNLHFYHDYSTVVGFNIMEELAKGNHAIDIISLFPVNTEFEQLKTYVTPFNTPSLRIALSLLGLFFFISSALFALSSIRKKVNRYRLFRVFVSLLCLVMFLYMFALVTNHDIYYFSAPFVHFNSPLISISSFIPFVMLIAIIPLVRFNYSVIKKNTWSFFWKLLITSNSISFVVLFWTFVYWGLYDVF